MRFGLWRTLAAGILSCAVGLTAFGQDKAFDITRIDESANACDNFFQYANGTWLKKTEIPAAFSNWGSFNILRDNNTETLHKVLDKAKTDAAQSPKGSDVQFIGDYYASCMDEEAIERAGYQPLMPMFKQIGKIKNNRDLVRQIAVMHNSGMPALFGFGASPDAKNSTMNIANAGQGGLSLPNRDYYTKTDPKSVEIREKFVAYMTDMFKMIGDSPEQAAANAATVMKIQNRLANASKTPVELRDPEKRYNKRTLAQLAEMSPNFSLVEYMKERGVPAVSEINVGQPEFFAEVNKMAGDVSIEDWKTYLRWMTLNSAAGRLSKSFVERNFDFYSRTLTGTKEMQPRWKRCTNGTDGALGEALGKEYVRTNFTPEAKKRMNELIDNLFAAYRERIMNLDWMGAETKQQALTKLAAFGRKIGYPDVLRGYQGLKISRKSYFDNSSNISRFEIARNLKDIGQKVDRTRWGMTPPTVNAYYSPLNNEIAFPAGILQPPFFNFAADDAINYGGIGAVIGHEISHGFDDQGSQYDAQGNLKMWWTKDDRTRFEQKASCVVKQFDSYEVDKDLFMNGKLTLGENIADLGGLTVAYHAFQKSLEGKPRPANIDGFTPEQRFFLGWAQVWATKARPEAIRNQVLTDPHAIAQYRVNGPTSNMREFAEAFQCKTGDKMIRAADDTCKIW